MVVNGNLGFSIISAFGFNRGLNGLAAGLAVRRLDPFFYSDFFDFTRSSLGMTLSRCRIWTKAKGSRLGRGMSGTAQPGTGSLFWRLSCIVTGLKKKAG